MADEDTSVRVAVRIRPQIARELIDNLGVCTSVSPGEPQVQLGKGNLFTYDHVFDTGELQEPIYEACVAQLVEGALEGYNATVLAYGQTGSGKTYTMGTGFEMTPHPEQIGILPRAISHIFSGIASRQEKAKEAEQPVPEFRVEAQFIELYNENLFDLLEPSRDQQEAKNIRIHGDHYGGISVEGVTRSAVRTEDDALGCLRAGALCRTTGETQMNTQSSRSHAIFTLHIQQRRIAPEELDDKENGITGDFETLTSKFHFVDLAGSERLHRTGATGERAREGISINCGLLALGNVISALGDKSKKVLHVPYRDSKLTRLLQDSLGGNSRTVMIACISPSTQDFMETLSTLKYANRARNIKNRVTLNQDKFSQQVTQLRQEIQRLQLELMEFRQGKRVVGEDGTEAVNDMFHENKMLLTDNSNLRLRLKAQQDTIETLTARNAELKTKIATSSWINAGGDAESSNQIHDMLNNYVKEIEDLTSKLTESEAMCRQLRAATRVQHRPALLSPRGNTSVEFPESPSVSSLIEVAKKGLQKDVDLLQRSKSEVLGSKGERENNGMDEEDESDDESEESSDSDSEDEKNAEEEERMGELVNLESEINIKQQLIEQLELSQRRMHSMKQQYEEKLRQLEARMEATKLERDKVLASLSGKDPGSQDGPSAERVKRVKDDYERKLSTMQKELKVLQSAKKEHARMLKEHSRNENQLRSLKNELAEMKRNKVKLLNRMKEESAKHKQDQERRNRELAQLRKANRKHENQIRAMEAEKRAKDVVLRRRQEEVTALRRNQYSGMSNKAAGRPAAVRKGGSSSPTRSYSFTVHKGLRRTEASLYPGVAVMQAGRKSHTFSPKAARQKWTQLEKNINQVSITKQTVADYEKQLERHLDELRQLHADHTLAQRRVHEAEDLGRDVLTIASLQEYVEQLQAGIQYVQDNILEVQQSIVQLEGTKEGPEPNELEAMVNEVDELGEARYIIQKLYTLTVNQSCAVAERERTTHQLEARIKQLEQHTEMQQQLLQHVLEQKGISTLSSCTTLADEPPPLDLLRASDSSDESRAPSPTPSIASSTRSKARKRTADPQQMLFMRDSFRASLNQQEPDTVMMPPPVPNNNNSRIPIAPSSLKITNNRIDPRQPSPLPTRKQFDGSASPRLARRGTFTISNNTGLGQATRLGSMDHGLDSTPPSSPPQYRRTTSREENVFSRLTSTTGVTRDDRPGQGVINMYSGRAAHKAPLLCTHVAEGHSKAVLSIYATDDLLFSASKDRTVKVWDLNQGQERESITGHPNNVIAVKYCERSHCVFSASSSFVKVWDLRQCPSRPIHTLCSSGLTANGAFTLSDPLALPQGASVINDIALNDSGDVLYMAAGKQVQIWDLRKFAWSDRLGQLTGHNAAVMCLAVGRVSNNVDRVVTGSKNHLAKVFHVPAGQDGYPPTSITLEPPHYDGIECLVLHGDTLFTGSRDNNIKKWNLSTAEQVPTMGMTHSNWVCGMALLHEGLLVSGCRGGVLKLWSPETAANLGEIKAHSSPINAVTTNSSCIFSASNCGEIRFWKAPQNSVMTMSTGHLFSLSL